MTKKKKVAQRADPLAITKAPCCGTCSMWSAPRDADKDPFRECGRALVTTHVLKPIWVGIRRVLVPVDEFEPVEPHRSVTEFGSLMDYADHVNRRSPPKRRASVEVRRIDPGELFSRQELLVIERGIPAEAMRTRSWARACSMYAPRQRKPQEWAMFREAMDDWDYWMEGVA